MLNVIHTIRGYMAMSSLALLAWSSLVISSEAGSAEAKMEHCRFHNANGCHVSSKFVAIKGINQLSLQAAKGNQPNFIATLKNYYDAAKKNDHKRITSLYTEADGSRKIIEESLRKSPTRYSRFHKVGDITVKKAYRAGNYHFVVVDWHDKQGKVLAEWSELLYCQKSCLMSDRLLKQTDTTSFFFRALGGGKEASYESKGNAFKTVTASTPNDDTTSISVAITPYSNMTAAEKSKTQTLVDLVQTVRANSVKVNETFSTNFPKLKSETLSLFKDYWPAIDDRLTYYYPNVKGYKVPFSSLGVYVLTSRLASITSLKPMFKVQGKDVGFYFFMAERQEKQELLMFFINDAGKLVSQADLKSPDSGIAQTLQHRFVYQALNDANIAIGGELLSDPKPYERKYGI